MLSLNGWQQKKKNYTVEVPWLVDLGRDVVHKPEDFAEGHEKREERHHVARKVRLGDSEDGRNQCATLVNKGEIRKSCGVVNDEMQTQVMKLASVEA